MAQKVFKVCWMSNEQGEEFIPKTILESIETASGTPLKEYIATKNLSDAKLTNVKHGQILEYDEASKKWINKNYLKGNTHNKLFLRKQINYLKGNS